MLSNRFSKPLIVVVIALLMLVTVSFAVLPRTSGYDQIEALRVHRENSLPVADQRYDTLEQVRLERGQATDRSYDQIETLRVQSGLASLPVDSSYDRIEQIRLER